jgi:hypothetical protein
MRRLRRAIRRTTPLSERQPGMSYTFDLSGLGAPGRRYSLGEFIGAFRYLD